MSDLVELVGAFAIGFAGALPLGFVIRDAIRERRRRRLSA